MNCSGPEDQCEFDEDGNVLVFCEAHYEAAIEEADQIPKPKWWEEILDHLIIAWRRS